MNRKRCILYHLFRIFAQKIAKNGNFDACGTMASLAYAKIFSKSTKLIHVGLHSVLYELSLLLGQYSSIRQETDKMASCFLFFFFKSQFPVVLPNGI